MGFSIPDLTNCDNQRYMAPAAGALTALTGLDQVFPAPRVVHWALAGAATDVYCQGGIRSIDRQLLLCAGGGAVSGFITTGYLFSLALMRVLPDWYLDLINVIPR